MSDLNFQDISTVASDQQPLPATIASTTSVAPKTFLSLISGTTAIATITPPVSGSHMLCFVFTTTTPTAFTTSGNVKLVSTPTQSLPVLLVYNAAEGKYYAK